MAVTYMTAEGYKNLVDELNELENVQRPAISRQIAEARDKGDLSENAEYDAAREAQGLLELKISQLKEIIANSRVIDESKINTDCVQILNKVKVKNLGNNAVMQFTLVGESEANLKENKIAATTPIGKALMGKKKVEVVETTTPGGKIKMERLDITISTHRELCQQFVQK